MNHPLDPKAKHGAKKAQLHLIPPYALAQAAKAHELGAKNHGPYNWRKTRVNATTYVAAILRHLGAWQDGEDNDPESGASHLAHIEANCNILMDAQHCGTLVDDRSKVPVDDLPDIYNTFSKKLREEGARAMEMMRLVDSYPSPSTIDPGEDYRTLVPKEVVQAGDEFYAGPGDWRKTHCVGMVIHPNLGCPYRRKVRKPITVEGWLETLPDGYRERAMRHCSQLDRSCRSLYSAIVEMDDWEDSVEGWEFWLDVFQRTKSNSDLPPLPLELPEGLPPLPPVPEGFSRWEYRGKGWSAGKVVYAAFNAAESVTWCFDKKTPHYTSGLPDHHYIEAIK